jgi:hypothetical protein
MAERQCKATLPVGSGRHRGHRRSGAHRGQSVGRRAPSRDRPDRTASPLGHRHLLDQLDQLDEHDEHDGSGGFVHLHHRRGRRRDDDHGGLHLQLVHLHQYVDIEHLPADIEQHFDLEHLPVDIEHIVDDEHIVDVRLRTTDTTVGAPPGRAREAIV